MILSKKIRLKPNKTQESLLWQSTGTARFIYNWTLGRQKENYESGGKFLSDNVLRKRRISNIRNNNLHQITNKIVKTKPSKIVMEELNIKGMMKNRHLSKAIAEQNFHRFITIMRYKCEFNGIEFVQVPRFYPSSKKCSKCGEIKKNLKLSDRVFQCECGNVMDRDLNASINLANYRVS